VDIDGPPRGSRDNGLRCGNYVAIADLDPRLIDALLETMRTEGIAAYAAPTPASTGGYMEQRLPSRPIDRLWVDDQKIARARELVDAETGAPIESERDFDEAWKQVLVSLQSGPGADPLPPWPVSEDVDADAVDNALSADADHLAPVDPADEEHFVPPPPPPVPRLRPSTVGAIAAIALGLLLIGTDFDGGSFNVVAIVAILAGGASLVWHMRQGPPTDSGWDDGAVV
jgi:hypothetical protein